MNAVNDEKIKKAAEKQFAKRRPAARSICYIIRNVSHLSEKNRGFKNLDYIGLNSIRNLYKNEPKFSDYEGLDGIQNLFKVKEDSYVNLQNVDNIQVKPFFTKGEGNCFFHAAFGDKTSNVYEAKEAVAMREEWRKFLSQFKSLDDPNMPKSLKDQLEKVFNFFLNNPEDLTNGSKEIKKLVDETNKAIARADQKATKLKNKIIKKFFEDENFQNIIYEIIERNIKQFNIRPESNTKNTPSIQDLLNDESKLDNYIQENLGSCVLELKPHLKSEEYRKKYDPDNITRSLFLNNEKLYKAYLNAIGTRGYFIFFEEIPILASLANTKITVYYNNGRKVQIFEPQEELLGGYKSNKELWGIKREVVIYYEGSHYSHADTEFSSPNSQLIENRKSKIVFSSIAGGVVGGILSYFVATSLLLNLWWMALGVTLGLTMGFAMSYYLTEPQVENTSFKMQPESYITY